MPTGRSVSLPANGSVAPVSLSVRAAARALRTLESMGFDVVHVHEPFTPGLPYGLLVGRRVPPLVATFHRNGGSALYTVLGPLARRLAGRFAVRTAVSEAARSTASHALGGTYEVGFNGIEVDRYRDVDPWPTDRPTILFLGRHEERKGLGVLLEAFDRLRRHGARRQPATGPADRCCGSPATARRPRPSAAATPGRPTSSGSACSPRRRRCAGWRQPTSCAPRRSAASRSAWSSWRPWPPGPPVVASDIDGYRAAAGGCAVLVPPGDAEAAGRRPGRGAGRAAGRVPRAAGRRPGTGPATGWLSAGAERADRWSMDRLAEWYEGWYRVGHGRPPAVSGRTLLGP